MDHATQKYTDPAGRIDRSFRIGVLCAAADIECAAPAQAFRRVAAVDMLNGITISEFSAKL